MQVQKHSSKNCVYCGMVLDSKNRTRDHIPPKCFFTQSERKRMQLITVPACKTCNNCNNVQDENAKHMLSLCVLQMQKETPELMQSHSRMLHQNHRLRKMVNDSEKILVQDTITRLYTFEQKIKIDKNYIADTEKVLWRIARGFYWHHFGNSLNTNKYKIYFHAGFDLFESAKIPQEIKRKKLEGLLLFMDNCAKVDLLPNVFSYWVGKTVDNDNATCFLILYRKAVLIGIFALPVAKELREHTRE